MPIATFALGVLCCLGGCVLLFWADLDRVQGELAAVTARMKEEWLSAHQDVWLQAEVRCDRTAN